MTTEHATLILRRKPQIDRERIIAIKALRALALACWRRRDESRGTTVVVIAE